MYPYVNECLRWDSHMASLHRVHDLPCSNWVRSSFVDPFAITAVLAGRHKPTWDQGGIQNKSSEGELSNQPCSSRDSF